MSINIPTIAPETLPQLTILANKPWTPNLGKGSILHILNCSEKLLKADASPNKAYEVDTCLSLLRHAIASNEKFARDFATKALSCYFGKKCFRVTSCRFNHADFMGDAAKILCKEMGIDIPNLSSSSAIHPSSNSQSSSSCTVPSAKSSAVATFGSSSSEAPQSSRSFLRSTAAPFVPKFASSSLSAAPIGSRAAPSASSVTLDPSTMSRTLSHDSTTSNLSILAAEMANRVLSSGSSVNDEILTGGPGPITRTSSGKSVESVTADTAHVAQQVAFFVIR